MTTIEIKDDCVSITPIRRRKALMITQNFGYGGDTETRFEIKFSRIECINAIRMALNEIEKEL